MPFGPKPRPLMDRFAEKIEIDGNGCWLWTGLRFRNGYARLATSKNQKDIPVLGHRLAWLLFNGWLPEGYHLVFDHLCRVKHCVNPEHLEVVQAHVNLRRGIGVHKDFCYMGHEMTPENTKVVYHRGYEDWLCRECRRLVYLRHDLKRGRNRNAG